MVQVKICGLTNLEDALAAVEAGADLLGFVFYPPSPRFVPLEQACRIIEVVRCLPLARRSSLLARRGGDQGTRRNDSSLPVPLSPCHCVSFVGVFVDEEPDRVREAIQICDLDYAQLHGEEPPAYVVALGRRAIKALRVRSAADVERLGDYQAAAYLLDAYHPTKPGGTGQAWDWGLAATAKRYGPIILAGGLTPDNVAQAVRQVRPWAVDVSSGVESAPGRKDIVKMRQFVAAASDLTRSAGGMV